MKFNTQIVAISILGMSLLACGTSGNNETATNQVTAPKVSIHEAAFFGNLEAINQHIEAGTDLNQKDEYGSTPLIVAITFNKGPVAKSLIAGGADLAVLSADGSTALHAAALYGRVEVVKLLMQKGIDLGVQNNYGATALTTAAAPFDQMKPIYDQLSRDLGPMGFKLDYEQLQADRTVIATLLQDATTTQSNQ